MLKIIQRGQFKFSRRILRFHTLNNDSFSPFANIESFSDAASSLKRQNTQNIYSVLIITLEATVLKVIRIFYLHQPVDKRYKPRDQ